MEQMKTLYQIDQNIHYVGAGTQQPAEIPNLKPAVSDFVREYLLRNSHSPWILNCLRNPSSCDKGTVLNMTHLTISFFRFRKRRGYPTRSQNYYAKVRNRYVNFHSDLCSRINLNHGDLVTKKRSPFPMVTTTVRNESNSSISSLTLG